MCIMSKIWNASTISNWSETKTWIDTLFFDSKYQIDLSTFRSYINPLIAKLFILSFHPFEVVSRWRDPQLQVSEKLFRFDKMEVNSFQILLVDVTFYL